VLKKEEIREN
jgi:hypothetical protein